MRNKWLCRGRMFRSWLNIHSIELFAQVLYPTVITSSFPKSFQLRALDWSRLGTWRVHRSGLDFAHCCNNLGWWLWRSSFNLGWHNWHRSRCSGRCGNWLRSCSCRWLTSFKAVEDVQLIQFNMIPDIFEFVCYNLTCSHRCHHPPVHTKSPNLTPNLDSSLDSSASASKESTDEDDRACAELISGWKLRDIQVTDRTLRIQLCAKQILSTSKPFRIIADQ